jgi:outer membrane lipoprotein-sorting protein
MLAASALFAQTPEEIIAKMDQATSRFDSEGFSMIMDIKVPLLGTFSSKMYTLGDKYKAILEVKGKKMITWSDGVTDWDYDEPNNEITITHADPSGSDTGAEGSLNALDGITEGYDVKLKKETADAWYFRSTKSKTNTKKDDPKSMDLVVSKTTYLPVSTSVSEKGFKITLHDFVPGVTEKEVTFNLSDYPNAKVTDKR